MSGRVLEFSALARYAIAVAVAALTIVVRLAMDPVWGVRIPFILAFPAIVVSAWLGGLWPGMLTTMLLAAATGYFWLEPTGSLRVASPADMLALATFLVVGGVISALNEAWHRGTARAVAAQRERAVLLERERRARADAEAAARQLQIAIDAGRMGTWQWTMESGKVVWSPGLERIHGYAPGTFPGTFEAFREEIHHDDRDRVLHAIAESSQAGRDHHIEYRIVRRDGSVRWVEGRGRLFLDAAGQPESMIGVCADTTERRHAEERVQLAVEAAPTAMVMVDRSGTIVFVNEQTEQLLGYARSELVGLSVGHLVPDRFRDRHAEYREAFAADPHRRPMGAGRDLFALRKDGTEVPVEIGLSPIRTADGDMVLAAVTDITARKQAETELREAKHAAEAANRTKDQFLAVLSHELRAPLQPILAYAHLLTSGKLAPDRFQQAGELIRRNVESQAVLIDSLLDLARVEAGKLELRLEEVDLSSVVAGAIDDVRPAADQKRLTLALAGPQMQSSILGDSLRLRQVVLNLLSNAIKFTPGGGRVDVVLTAVDSRIELRVQDNGRGMSADFLPRVFDRFSQADGRGQAERTGLGLGLAIASELVTAHGGSIVAESDGEGLGSNFTVSLPRHQLPNVPHHGDRA